MVGDAKMGCLCSDLTSIYWMCFTFGMTSTTAHITTVQPAEAETPWKDGAYSITCSHCGHVHTYRGYYFTVVEAQRHTDYFANLVKKGRK